MTALANRLQEVSYGIHIEAVPYLDGRRDDGAVWLFGDAPTWESETGFHDALESLPATISWRVDPFTGEVSLSALQASISAITEAISLLFGWPEPAGRVGEDDGAGGWTGSATAGSANVTVTSSETIGGGDYIWINNECLYVTGRTVDGDVYTLSVARGMAGSPDEAHPAGTNVYLQCPLDDLEPVVTLYLYDHRDQTTSVLWSGLLDDGMATDDDQNSLVVRASELRQRLVELEAGTQPVKCSAENLRLREDPVAGGLSGSLLGTLRPYDDDPDWVNASITEKIMRVGDYLGPYNWDATNRELTPSGVWALGGRIREGEPGEAYSPSTIHEVLCVDREGRFGVTHNSFDGIDGDLNFAAVALALLLSTGNGDNDPAFGTYDVLGKTWGVGFPAKLIDESWAALIDAERGQIDQLLLGYDGGFDPWETVRDLVIGNGCFLSQTKTGKLSIQAFDDFGPATIGDIMTAHHWSVVEPSRIRLQRSTVRPNAAAEIGDLGHGHWEGDVLSVDPLKGTRKDTSTFAKSPQTYRMPWRYPGSAGEDAALDFLSQITAKRSAGIPTLHVNIPWRHYDRQLQASDDTAREICDPGGWIRLRAPTEFADGSSDLEVIGPNGTRVNINDAGLSFVGRLVGGTLHIDSGIVEAEILLEGWGFDAPPRLVAPEIRVFSYDALTGWLTVQNDWISPDGETAFSAGDQVELVLESSKRWLGDPGGLTVTDVDNTSPYRVQLSADPDALPSEAVYLRLADADTYSNDGWEGAEWFAADIADRRWSYIADTDGLVGDVDADPPDRWSA